MSEGESYKRWRARATRNGMDAIQAYLQSLEPGRTLDSISMKEIREIFDVGIFPVLTDVLSILDAKSVG